MGEMRKVKLLVTARTGNGRMMPGSIVDLPKHYADLMISRREAEPYPPEQKKKPSAKKTRKSNKKLKPISVKEK
jgi:hypothetical protein